MQCEIMHAMRNNACECGILHTMRYAMRNIACNAQYAMQFEYACIWQMNESARNRINYAKITNP